MPKLKAVIFDMDGVLIDAKDWHYEALNRALALFGHTIPRYDHLVTYDGLPTRQKLEMLSRERNLPRSLHDFISVMKQKYTIEAIHTRCKPTFQHEYCLSRLKADGYLLALASNAVRSSVELMTEKAHIRRFFDLVLSNEDVSRAKPDPEIYFKAAAGLGVAPEACFVVEDHIRGVQAARAAGCRVLQVASVTEVTYETVVNSLRLAEAGQP